MTPTTFWLITGMISIVAIISTIINNAQFQLLKQLISYLGTIVKPSLIKNGEPDKARTITLKEIPKLEDWYNECQNYGLVNIFGLLSVLGLTVSGGIYHYLSYIIVMLSTFSFVANILFFPKALNRLNEAVTINNNYVLLMKAFETLNDTQKQETKNNGTGSTSFT